jgi:hypothetical protein
MIRRVNFIVLMLFLSISVIGQNLTTSPYSFFGIGEIEEFNNGQTQGLGGAGIGLHNNYHLNLKNPASYASFDSLSFKYEFGVRSKITTLTTSLSEETVDDHGLSYLAMGFPITKKWHTTIALLPMSSVGYRIEDNYIDYNVGNVEQIYIGEGGLNQFMIGNSYKINKNIFIGLNTSYTFGKISYFKSLLLPDLSSSVNSIYESKLHVKGLSYKFGAQYSFVVKDAYDVVVGFTFDNQSKLNVDAQTLAGASYYSYSDYLNTNSVSDTTNYYEGSGDMIIPTKLGFGVSFNNRKNLLAAIDYEFQKWEDSEILGTNAGLDNYSKLSGGIEYIPAKNHPKFFKRINYRFGVNYADSYLNINNTQITSQGVNVGFGIPVRRSKTSFNINFEYGQRGTVDNNLIKENYAIISLTLSLSDIWFYKRKFD